MQDLTDYLSLLFNLDDRVGYVTGDVWQDGEGKWLPSKGVYDRTAGELIASLKKHPNDIGATVGDWKPEAGGWIRFNPLDGEGVKNENVTKFKYALVESCSGGIRHTSHRRAGHPLPQAGTSYRGSGA